MAVVLLAPCPPLLFMGEEFAAATPFLFFCDFGPDLAARVSAGRRAEFPQFMIAGKSKIPDPNCKETFLRSKIDWTSIDESFHRTWLESYRTLLALRRSEIVPRIRDIQPGRAQYTIPGPYAVSVRWPFAQGGSLDLRANLGATGLRLEKPHGRVLYSTASEQDGILAGEVPPHSTTWFLT